MIKIDIIFPIYIEYKVYFKQHNTDYLSNESLSWHPKYGIHAANVAPEFGTTESVSFVRYLKENGYLIMRM